MKNRFEERISKLINEAKNDEYHAKEFLNKLDEFEVYISHIQIVPEYKQEAKNTIQSIKKLKDVIKKNKF